MLIPWQTYYQNNKHLPLNKIVEQYARVVRDFNEQMAAMSANAAPGAGVGGVDDVTPAPTPSVTPTISVTPSVTPTITPTSSNTPTPTPTPTPSA